MIWTIIKKEILDYAVSLRFVILVVLCFALIPLSLYVNYQIYQRWLVDYNEQLRIEKELKGRSSSGSRPPSPLAVLANGVEASLAKDFRLAQNEVELGKARSYGDPIYEIFGRIDFLFVVQAILSLIAFLFAFDAVSGEKEMGTLKLCLANPVPRHEILLGKLVGGMLVLTLPFLLSFISGLIILKAAGYPLFDKAVLSKIAITLAISIVYVCVFYLIGIFISAFSHQSKTSLILLMFIWIIFVVVMPRLSVIAARLVRPVEDDFIITLRKKLLVQGIQKEKGNALISLYTEKSQQLGGKGFMFDAKDQDFVGRRNEIAKPFEERMRKELDKIDEDHRRKRQWQLDLARNIARVSPASIFSYLVTDITDTGEMVKTKFLDLVGAHYAAMDRLVFSKMYMDMLSMGDNSWGFSGNLPGERPPRDMPRFEFNFPNISYVLSDSSVDIVLLLIYALLFFIASQVAFIRFDVR